MSTDLQIADVEEDSRKVAPRMLGLGVRHLTVLKSGELVGIVSMRDLIAVGVCGLSDLAERAGAALA